MDHIRVSNIRCLADTGPIDLLPITLLVGANSSGKSTFLRIFPLLRQSIEMRTISGLVLNEGEVNFGFFSEALHRDASPAELKIEVGLTLQQGIFQGTGLNSFLIGPTEVSCELTYAKRSKDARYPYLRSVRLILGNDPTPDVIEICADENAQISKFTVNEYQGNNVISRLRLRVERGLVPVLVQALVEKDGAPQGSNEDVEDFGLFDQSLLSETDNLFHGRTAKGTRLATISAIRIGTPQQMLEVAKQIGGVGSWHQRVENWTTSTPQFRKVRNLLIARAATDLLSSVNISVSQLARSVHYFQPVRASVQRDYLSRDVQVDSVDPSGLNVAMVLASLDRPAQEKFREWMITHFGFEIFPQSVSDGARVSLRMREKKTGAEFNLADMGFGFSQMLPFLVQMWNLVEYEPLRRQRRPLQLRHSMAPRSFLIAIEQPELHLHPALQARLADLIVVMARLSSERKIPVRFVLETHSPTIIERIGQSIEAKRLEASDVQVLLFERGLDESKPDTATVRHSTYDAQGVLKDWPFGFLSAPPELSPSPGIDTIPGVL